MKIDGGHARIFGNRWLFLGLPRRSTTNTVVHGTVKINNSEGVKSSNRQMKSRSGVFAFGKYRLVLGLLRARNAKQPTDISQNLAGEK